MLKLVSKRADRLFHKISLKGIVLHVVMIPTYVKLVLSNNACHARKKMRECNVVSWDVIVSVYSRSESCERL